MSTGVGKLFRWQFMERTNQTHLDPKPDFDKVVNWVVTNEDEDPEPENLTQKKWLNSKEWSGNFKWMKDK